MRPKRQWALAAAILLGAATLAYGLAASAQAPWVDWQRRQNGPDKSLWDKWRSGERRGSWPEHPREDRPLPPHVQVPRDWKPYRQ